MANNITIDELREVLKPTHLVEYDPFICGQRIICIGVPNFLRAIGKVEPKKEE